MALLRLLRGPRSPRIRSATVPIARVTRPVARAFTPAGMLSLPVRGPTSALTTTTLGGRSRAGGAPRRPPYDPKPKYHPNTRIVGLSPLGRATAVAGAVSISGTSRPKLHGSGTISTPSHILPDAVRAPRTAQEGMTPFQQRSAAMFEAMRAERIAAGLPVQDCQPRPSDKERIATHRRAAKFGAVDPSRKDAKKKTRFIPWC